MDMIQIIVSGIIEKRVILSSNEEAEVFLEALKIEHDLYIAQKYVQQDIFKEKIPPPFLTFQGKLAPTVGFNPYKKKVLSSSHAMKVEICNISNLEDDII